MTLKINNHYVLYYYSSTLHIYDIKHHYNRIDLSRVEADIILSINQYHDPVEAWQRLCLSYNMDDTNQEGLSLYHSFLNELINKEILINGNDTAHIYGEEGKTFPLSISLELTNSCNFHCSHCYKEAQITNRDFIDIEMIKTLMSACHDKLQLIELTGGEATLHPRFNEIVELLDAPVISLLTNGSCIQSLSKKSLQKITDYQISLYGHTSEEYTFITGYNSFEAVCNGIRTVISLQKPLTIAIVINNLVIENFSEYLVFLSNLGVKHIRFGIPRQLGRNQKKPSNTIWDITSSKIKSFVAQLDEYRKKYPDILIEDLSPEEHIDQAVSQFSEAKKYTFRCDAGTRSVVLSEKGMIRPCVYLPQNIFERKQLKSLSRKSG